MLASQTHALRASEIRKRLAELAAVKEMTDEQRLRNRDAAGRIYGR